MSNMFLFDLLALIPIAHIPHFNPFTPFPSFLIKENLRLPPVTIFLAGECCPSPFMFMAATLMSYSEFGSRSLMKVYSFWNILITFETFSETYIFVDDGHGFPLPVSYHLAIHFFVLVDVVAENLAVTFVVWRLPRHFYGRGVYLSQVHVFGSRWHWKLIILMKFLKNMPQLKKFEEKCINFALLIKNASSNFVVKFKQVVQKPKRIKWLKFFIILGAKKYFDVKAEIFWKIFTIIFAFFTNYVRHRKKFGCKEYYSWRFFYFRISKNNTFWTKILKKERILNFVSNSVLLKKKNFCTKKPKFFVSSFKWFFNSAKCSLFVLQRNLISWKSSFLKNLSPLTSLTWTLSTAKSNK